MGRISKADIDTQKKWEEHLTRSKSVRANWKKKFKVDLGIDYFEGKQNPGYPEDEWLTINKVYAHIKAALPTLYSNDPYFYITLKRSFSPDPQSIALYEERAKIRQAMLNYLKDEVGLKQEVRISIQDAMFGFGICKTYYHVESIKNPEAGKPILGEDGVYLIDDQGSILQEPEYIPKNERYVVERVHPNDFLFDEDAGPSPKTWKWVAQCIRMTMDEARKNPLFSKSAIANLDSKDHDQKDQETRNREERKKGGDIKGRAEQIGQGTLLQDDGQKIIYVWEIYEIQRKKWTVIAENGTVPLVNDEDVPLGIESHPFSVLRFTLRDDSPYPIPPISQGIDPQKEYNIARSRIMTHRKRFNRKYTAVGQWEETELSKLESGDDGTIIKSPVPGSAIVPIADAPLDQQGYLEINALNMDMIELFGGHHDESRGIASADSATQAAILDKRLEIKEGDELSQVVDFVKDIAKKLDQLVQAHIDKDEAVKVVGPQGEFWKVVRTNDYEEINGEFQYDVNIGSTIPKLPQVERSSWMSFLQLIASAPQLMLSKALLTEMAHMHHIENDNLIAEVYSIGQMIMRGQTQAKTPGSLPNVSQNNPVTVTGGQEGGVKSLNLPLAGNAEG